MLLSDKPIRNLISRLNPPQEIKWSLPVGQYKIQEPVLRDIKPRYEKQQQNFNQFAQELLESESSRKPSTYQQQYLHQTTSLFDLDEQRKKLLGETSWQQQRLLYPTLQDKNKNVMSSISHQSNGFNHKNTAEYLIIKKVSFKPSLPANRGNEMSVIDPPQLAPRSAKFKKKLVPKIIPQEEWIPLVHM